ncbi:MAG: carbon starvation protein A [Deltaproteobacteria bacterium]|jgi:carbon starvation protein|nr:carbon starvation protein A [Deltaproteobacteria bacterium]
MTALQDLNGLTLLIVALCVFAIGYRYYGLWLANKVLKLDAKRATPASFMADGVDYVATHKNVLFGYHFSSISAAGPLLGPVLAAQFGYLPGALWILVGSVLAGAVHDMVVLFASVRHRGRSLAAVATREIGPGVGLVTSIAVLFIVVLTLAGLSIAVVNAMYDSPWGTFTVFATIPIAFLMGCLLRIFRLSVTFVSIFGAILLLLAVLVGPYVVSNPTLSGFFTFDRQTLSWFVPIYGFIASILPIWLLLCPRDYISTYLKIGTIVALALGVILVRPVILMEPLTSFAAAGGPVIGGPMVPFLFITIACGALSGFHAIIGTGTTPKMISNERDILFVGYGAMLAEGFVAIMALIAVTTLIPADYYAITASKEAFARMGIEAVDLRALEAAVRENLAGRAGGGVTLAAGMANIFSNIPGMSGLISYWYHFAIMFEAVFILTAIDSGTRVGRLFLQELLGRYIPAFNRHNWWPGLIATSLIFSSALGYLVVTGDIAFIWPLFGMSNQLLAACTLIIATSLIIRLGRAKYAWCTGVPGLLMAGVTIWAGSLQIFQSYLPAKRYLLAFLGLIVGIMMIIVLIGAVIHWLVLLRRKTTVTDRYGDKVLVLVEE